MNWVTLPLPAVFLDAGLLLLRIWLGLSVFLIHGFSKVQDFGGTLVMFRDNMGIAPLFGTGAILAESLCALLLAIGLATRWAAGLLALTMAVAFSSSIRRRSLSAIQTPASWPSLIWPGISPSSWPARGVSPSMRNSRLPLFPIGPRYESIIRKIWTSIWKDFHYPSAVFEEK